MHADTRYCTLLFWAVVLLLSKSRAIIKDLNEILHGFMLQIIYTYFFWAVVLLLSESRAIINNLNVTIHGFMLQIIDTIIFRVQWLSNIYHASRLIVEQVNSVYDLIWFIVFNATFSNISAISWRPVLVVEEIGVPGETHRPWTNNW